MGTRKYPVGTEKENQIKSKKLINNFKFIKKVIALVDSKNFS